jgi:hypothetical protein
MDANSYGLIEMVVSFGVVLAIGFQQLRSVKKARETLREREEAAKAAREPKADDN